MRLLNQPTSPFGRKVRMTAELNGVSDQLEIVFADTARGDDELLASSTPLGKIPVLLLDDGTSLYDSRVICEYLDSMSGEPKLFPDAGPERWQCLTQAAAADGVVDAAVLVVYEKRFRPEDMRVESWVERQRGKMDAGLRHFEQRIGKTDASALSYADICIACMLGYLDLRFNGEWRQSYPKLVTWLDDFAARIPAFAKTAPPPRTPREKK